MNPNSQIVESLWDAYNFLKEIQDTTGDQHWGAGPLIERLRLAAVAAQSNGPSDSSALQERIAQITAHRACGNQEHDAANGKLAGYCVVCQVPWPCTVAAVQFATDGTGQ